MSDIPVSSVCENPDNFEYVDKTLDAKKFGRSMKITEIKTDPDTGEKYYAFAPSNLEAILDTPKGASFSATFVAKKNLQNVSQYFTSAPDSAWL